MKAQTKLTLIYIYVLCLMLLVQSCSLFKSIRTVYVDANQLGPGSSGMAQVDSFSFLAVYDLKNFEKGPRLGFIRTYADSIRVFPVSVTTWKSEDGIPSDLESITRLPNRKNEYLISESGNWQGKLGRIFHIKFNPQLLEATVKGVINIPQKKRNDFDIVGDQYEGIACIACKNQLCSILLAERGGSTTYPDGKLKWAEINLNTKKLSWSAEGQEGVTVNAPGDWQGEDKRDLTDLFIDRNGEIWASASQDRGDSGPFYSVIYKLGEVSNNSPMPFTLMEAMEVYKAFPGYKIEALSGPSISSPNSRFSFGTEDEIYGGTWRPIE